jgi:WLM domain
MSSSKSDPNCIESFPVQLSYHGKTVEVEATVETTTEDLVEIARECFISVEDDVEMDSSDMQLKLLYKGKKLTATFDDGVSPPVFALRPTKVPKIIVLMTESTDVAELNSKRSDPTIRGFNQEKEERSKNMTGSSDPWGPLLSKQDKNYKFCRFETCSWQSFGHRPGETTPHDFAARNLLQKLATDPGIVAVVRDRELVVGTLGEMDPIDDRLMQQKQQQGVCLLGYNTNGGTRIDLKLRTDDLKSFRPYHQLARTLLHELSQNWVGEHNYLFWTNYGQMMVEYCATHAFATAGVVVLGQTTAQIAGLPASIRTNMDQVYEYVMSDLRGEMIHHHLNSSLVEVTIRSFCDELSRGKGYGTGRLLGDVSTVLPGPTNSRDLALQAAERRRQNNEKQDGSKKPSD